MKRRPDRDRYGPALVLPGHSHSGKTRLAIELPRRGADYRSDALRAVAMDAGRIVPNIVDLLDRPAAVKPRRPAASSGA